MKPKNKKRTWFDVQIVILTVAMTTVLSMWNLFAGPDREAALASQKDELADNPVPIEDSAPPPVVTASVPPSGEKIMLGGKEPQTTIVVQKSRGKSTTSTRSS